MSWLKSGFVQWPLAIAAIMGFVGIYSGDGFVIFLATSACVSYALALSYNLLYGFAGVFSLAHVAVFGVGSYAAVVAQTRADMPFLPAALLAVVMSSAISALLWAPTRRLKGLFLAIATLGFATAVSEAFLKWTDVTGGAEGIYAIPYAKVGGTELASNETSYLIFCALLAFACWRIFSRMTSSMLRLEMTALRDAPKALVSVGASPGTPSLAAFVVAGAMAGLAGVLFAHHSLFISADAFDLHRLILLILAVQLGGPGTRLGPVVGVIAMLAIDEAGVAASSHKDLILGVAIIVLLGYSRAGLVPLLASLVRRVGGRFLPQPSHTDAPATVSHDQALGFQHLDSSELVVRDVGVRFGGVQALNDVTLEVRSGQVLGLIGPNGAGKSTLVNIVTGFVKPTQGEVHCDGRRLDGMTTDAVARLGVVRTFQSPNLMFEASAVENVMLGYATRSKATKVGQVFLSPAARRDVSAARAAAGELLLELGLAAHMFDQPIGSQPYAWQRLVEIARALVASPRFLLLDEPGAGIDDEEREVVAAMIRRVAQAGVGVVLIDHNVRFVRSVADSLVVLSQGELLTSGDPDAVFADERVGQVYFGGAVR